MAIHDYTVFSGLSLDSAASNTLSPAVALNGKGLTMAGGALSLGSFGIASLNTASAVTFLAADTFGIVQQASGVSLVFRSGSTYYAFGSTTSAAVT